MQSPTNAQVSAWDGVVLRLIIVLISARSPALASPLASPVAALAIINEREKRMPRDSRRRKESSRTMPSIKPTLKKRRSQCGPAARSSAAGIVPCWARPRPRPLDDRLDVDRAFRQLRELGVRPCFLIQRLLEQSRVLVPAEELRIGADGAVARDLVVLDLLGGGDQS